MSTDKAICTIDTDVIFRQPRDVEGLAPCSHDEAESRVMVHVADAASRYKLLQPVQWTAMWSCLL